MIDTVTKDFNSGYQQALKEIYEIAKEDCDEFAINNVVAYCEEKIKKESDN